MFIIETPVVEDELMVRELTCDILEGAGYAVLASKDVDDDIDLARNHEGDIHLVLTDVVMPGMKGPELFGRVAELHPEAKVLYMSGYTENVITNKGFLMEGVEFIQEPFKVHDFIGKVARVLGK